MFDNCLFLQSANASDPAEVAASSLAPSSCVISDLIIAFVVVTVMLLIAIVVLVVVFCKTHRNRRYFVTFVVYYNFSLSASYDAYFHVRP